MASFIFRRHLLSAAGKKGRGLVTDSKDVIMWLINDKLKRRYVNVWNNGLRS